MPLEAESVMGELQTYQGAEGLLVQHVCRLRMPQVLLQIWATRPVSLSFRRTSRIWLCVCWEDTHWSLCFTWHFYFVSSGGLRPLRRGRVGMVLVSLGIWTRTPPCAVWSGRLGTLSSLYRVGLHPGAVRSCRLDAGLSLFHIGILSWTSPFAVRSCRLDAVSH